MLVAAAGCGRASTDSYRRMQQHATWRRDEASRDAVVVMQVVGVMLALGPCVRPIAFESPFDHWIPFDALAPSICPDASHGPLVVIPRAAVAAPPPHLSPLLASWDWEAIKIHQQDVDLVPNQGLTLGLFRMRWCDFAIPNRDSDAWGSAVTDR
ncbi:hypothetical protein CH63R_04991 [Colletotrichum higginsianum IMI 349063]|uniref:Uncharacterized protein n=1 Tax=Colletotrichum higginsianum (strain IMI 349063) TaxID=759273 RepID=A0A1B7YKZ8_COLHI|nr:hypothetical protein CH63R_04991 [Colletotrichum higginsianum IMI 349063]OBR12695.1 hypothetical protein CH63R_04991 [Colletotrichum higginsianum IMI 349063]